MFFSIVVPVYNTAAYLNDCVRSILCQTFCDLELILVDDGSPDESGGICDSFAAEDPRVKVIHQENAGLSAARNAGIDRALGSYVMFIDSDDYLATDAALALIYKNIDTTGADVVCYEYRRDTEGKMVSRPKKEMPDSDMALMMLRKGVLTCAAWNKAVRRSLLEEMSIRFVPRQLSEDILWTFALLLKAARFSWLPEQLYVYRIREFSITKTTSEKHLDDLFIIMNRLATAEIPTSVSEDRKQAALSYAAYQFCTLLVNIRRNGNVSRLKEAKQFDWLLQHRDHPRVGAVSLCYHLLGTRMTSGLLYIMYQYLNAG